MHNDDVEKYYKEVYEDYLPVIQAIGELSSTLDEYIHSVSHLEDPLGLKVVSYSLYRSAHSLFFDSVNLYQNNRYLSCAIISRSIMECMGNIAWLMESSINDDGKRSRVKAFNQKIDDIEKLASGEIEHVKKLPLNIEKRIAIMGDYWQFQYRYISSYAHVDTGYMTHHFREEIGGVLNLFMLNDIVAFANILNKLIKLHNQEKVLMKDLTAIKDAIITSLRRHESILNPLPNNIDLFSF
jgi:hypothetical protein